MQMIPYGRQDISQADIDAVVDILHSDLLTQGPMVPRFEQEVAKYAGAHHAVATNSATSALHIACLALDLGPGDWLWTSANTFVASANVGLYCGARVDFVDIDPRTYNMSVDCLAEKLEQAKAKSQLPKIVIPVHFAGQSCNMAAIYALAQRYGFRVIEDASHAIGAQFQNSPVGNCQYSDITVFSFHPVKIITSGEGGMALTNEASLFERMSRYRSHGITSQQQLMKPRQENEIWNYQQIDLGFNYRMTDIHAALGLSQLQRLDEFVSLRRDIACRYDKDLSLLSLDTPWQLPDANSSYHLYPIRVSERNSGKTQRQVYEYLWKSGIAVNLHYIPVYRQPYYTAMGFNAGYCANAEAYYRETISLPIFPKLRKQDYKQVVAALTKILSA